jgi:hypothetical protein
LSVVSRSAHNIGFSVCLRRPGLKKAKYFRSLSPQSDAPRRIGAVADEERS